MIGDSAGGDGNATNNIFLSSYKFKYTFVCVAELVARARLLRAWRALRARCASVARALRAWRALPINTYLLKDKYIRNIRFSRARAPVARFLSDDH